MRAVQALGPAVVSSGAARRRAYAARRTVRGSIAPIPLYRIDAGGDVEEVALLHPTHPGGCLLEYRRELEWPLDPDMQDGWYEGLPYPLEDMRPQGFLGRHFAKAHALMLQVAEDPRLWSEDDLVHVLSVLGSDQPGAYVLGEPALRSWLARSRLPVPALSDRDIKRAYPTLATEALLHGVPGSSAGGEFPKFTATRQIDGRLQHMLVKFSGSDDAPGTSRWGDLLVCECLASIAVREHLGIPAAQSTVHQFGGRTFLEVQRFDRQGAHGRAPVCSWQALNAGLFGMSGKSWIAAADALAAKALIDAENREQTKTLWHFGQLIANSDMHDGNLSFFPGLRLAPTYDMLPMLYAPERGVELAASTFNPPLPVPAERNSWNVALRAAQRFWGEAAADGRITPDFRRVCAANAEHLRTY